LLLFVLDVAPTEEETTAACDQVVCAYVPSLRYAEILKELVKRVTGVGGWKKARRGTTENRYLGEVVSDSDEAFLVWVLDCYWNEWVTSIGTGQDADPYFDFLKQEPGDKNDWLHYGRPTTGAWFIRNKKEDGAKQENMGLTKFGKKRWTYWYKRIKMMRADSRNFPKFEDYFENIVEPQNEEGSEMHQSSYLVEDEGYSDDDPIDDLPA